MRTTVDIDAALLEEAGRLTGTRIKRQLLEESLRALIREKHLKDLKGMIGSGAYPMTLKDLNRLRAKEK